ncbi:single-strand DNA-binding protein [Microbacterium resistens]|uniref:Single-stranded DNA-binding protein n=1 Tax=Microbacterium resistens TaxID=156977 RepID=A0ABU1S8Y8_9MICO|nr:single-stranded DNA-binding protein [Microbacterium resistens]MDR6866061.1 single-strand DNA-binding protein [Microbacterium resistens]
MTDIITLVGNIASTPESTQTHSGVEVLTFRLATNNRRFDAKTGDWVDAGTNWYTVSAYRRLAENARTSLGKGDSVIVTGRLRLREWESNGRRGMSAEIDAESLGPDLRWGTSRFTRAQRPVRAEDARTERTDPVGGAGGEPDRDGRRAEVDQAVPSPEDVRRDHEARNDASAWAPLTLGETPF